MSVRYSVQGFRTGGGKVPVRALVAGSDSDEVAELAVLCWLLEGGGRRIMIDTGLRPVPLPGNETKFDLGPGEDTAARLAHAGVDPGSVDAVIFTHLHHDHAENASLFGSAHYLVSGRGWRSAVTPVPEHFEKQGRWPRDTFGFLVADAYHRLRLLGDDEEAFPGVRVSWVGGHTPCSQLVSVDTAAGAVTFAGDNAFLYRNLDERRPVTLAVDRGQADAALRRVLDSGDIVVPGHDPEFFDRHPGGRIG